jgi:putative aldouronate transport system permease protein
LYRKTPGETIFDILNYLFITVVAVLTVFPFWNVLVVSFTPYSVLVQNPLILIPPEFTVDSYRMVFMASAVIRGMLISVFVTVFGTFFNMVVTVGAAFVLSKRTFPGRNLVLTLIILTMFFDGGIIPYYLTVQKLGLIDSVFVMILPVAVNTWYLLIVKNYFQTVPLSLQESAEVDGANDITILVKIVLPVSMPVIATFILFYSVARWNEWWHATLFLNNQKLFPLQRILRSVVVQQNLNQREVLIHQAQLQNATLVGARSAIIVLATVPLTIVYPFLQKYVAKGIIVGALKS